MTTRDAEPPLFKRPAAREVQAPEEAALPAPEEAAPAPAPEEAPPAAVRPAKWRRVRDISELPIPEGVTLGCSKCVHKAIGCRACRGRQFIYEAEDGSWYYQPPDRDPNDVD